MTITSNGGQALAVAADLRMPAEPARVADAAVKTYGGIDIVVNNAGATKRGDFLQLSDDDWADGFALKFFGAVRLTRAAWPELKKRVRICTEYFRCGRPHAGSGIHDRWFGECGSAFVYKSDGGCRNPRWRSGERHQPRHDSHGRLQMRLASIVKEQQIDIETAERRFVQESKVTRIGEPEDVANLVAFVVGPEGRFLQGSLIDLDGGSTKTI